MTKSTKPQFVVRPTAYRAWNGSKMVDVQTLSWNAGGMLWHGAGGQMGWAWINPEYKGWSESNPKPSDGDIRPAMQWTGEKDSEGNDIWEGDIVSYHQNRYNLYKETNDKLNPCIGVVRFETGTGFGIDGYSFYQSEGAGRDSYKVLGNIFQNPELLET